MGYRIKDEGFVRGAFNLLAQQGQDYARWVANQSAFNGPGQLDPSTHAALVTAVSIYGVNNPSINPFVDEALLLKSREEARDFIDKLQLHMEQYDTA